MTAEAALQDLEALASPADGVFLQRFFKTGPGEYGEGDKFLGIRMPVLRQLAKQYQAMDLAEIQRLLDSSWHEARMLGLVIMVRQSGRTRGEARRQLVDLYLRNTRRINNWDLVDVSVRDVIGDYLIDQPRDLLFRLAKSPLLWERRMAMVATWAFIRRRDYTDTLKIAELLLPDRHDLIQKAVGWMLREVGKYGGTTELKSFLDRHADEMGRTALRYAIEHYDAPTRQAYLAKKGLSKLD